MLTNTRRSSPFAPLPVRQPAAIYGQAGRNQFWRSRGFQMFPSRCRAVLKQKLYNIPRIMTRFINTWSQHVADEARIPSDIRFKTKPEIAPKQIR